MTSRRSILAALAAAPAAALVPATAAIPAGSDAELLAAWNRFETLLKFRWEMWDAYLAATRTIPPEIDWRHRYDSPADMTADEKERYDEAYDACGCEMFIARQDATDKEFAHLQSIIIAATPTTIQGLAAKLRFTWIYENDFPRDLALPADPRPSELLLWSAMQATERLAHGAQS